MRDSVIFVIICFKWPHIIKMVMTNFIGSVVVTYKGYSQSAQKECSNIFLHMMEPYKCFFGRKTFLRGISWLLDLYNLYNTSFCHAVFFLVFNLNLLRFLNWRLEKVRKVAKIYLNSHFTDSFYTTLAHCSVLIK